MSIIRSSIVETESKNCTKYRDLSKSLIEFLASMYDFLISVIICDRTSSDWILFICFILKIIRFKSSVIDNEIALKKVETYCETIELYFFIR